MNRIFKRVKRTDAFTLVEIMIVISIIGLLSAMAIPAFQRVRFNSRVVHFMNDLRVAVDAFGIYSLEEGTYPLDKYPSIIPNGMDEYLAGMNWINGTPIGGRWDWDFESVGITAGVTVIGPGLSYLHLQEIDNRIDDGNLSTGCFRQTDAGGYSYVIEE